MNDGLEDVDDITASTMVLDRDRLGTMLRRLNSFFKNKHRQRSVALGSLNHIHLLCSFAAESDFDTILAVFLRTVSLSLTYIFERNVWKEDRSGA